MSLINPKTNLTNFLCPMSAEWNIALVPPVNYGLPALHDLEIEWKINVRYSSDVACRKIRDKKVTNFRRKRPIVWCFRSLNDGKCPEKRESDYVWKTMTWGDLKAVTHDWKYIATMSDSISLFSCPSTFTMLEKYSKCRIWIFQTWYFSPIFVLLKVTCLVALL